ncbi:MAG: hypothetical protein WB870_06640 [Gallionellaceae bacterium]
MKANETLFDAVERVMQPRVPQVSDTDRVMICQKCIEFVLLRVGMEVAKAGELLTVYHDCGEVMEQMQCSRCDEWATRIIDLGATLIGEGQGAHWESNEDPRCDKHWRR